MLVHISCQRCLAFYILKQHDDVDEYLAEDIDEDIQFLMSYSEFLRTVMRFYKVTEKVVLSCIVT